MTEILTLPAIAAHPTLETSLLSEQNLDQLSLHAHAAVHQVTPEIVTPGIVRRSLSSIQQHVDSVKECASPFSQVPPVSGDTIEPLKDRQAKSFFMKSVADELHKISIEKSNDAQSSLKTAMQTTIPAMLIDVYARLMPSMRAIGEVHNVAAEPPIDWVNVAGTSSLGIPFVLNIEALNSYMLSTRLAKIADTLQEKISVTQTPENRLEQELFPEHTERLAKYMNAMDTAVKDYKHLGQAILLLRTEADAISSEVKNDNLKAILQRTVQDHIDHQINACATTLADEFIRSSRSKTDIKSRLFDTMYRKLARTTISRDYKYIIKLKADMKRIIAESIDAEIRRQAWDVVLAAELGKPPHQEVRQIVEDLTRASEMETPAQQLALNNKIVALTNQAITTKLHSMVQELIHTVGFGKELQAKLSDITSNIENPNQANTIKQYVEMYYHQAVIAKLHQEVEHVMQQKSEGSWFKQELRSLTTVFEDPSREPYFKSILVNQVAQNLSKTL